VQWYLPQHAARPGARLCTVGQNSETCRAAAEESGVVPAPWQRAARPGARPCTVGRVEEQQRREWMGTCPMAACSAARCSSMYTRRMVSSPSAIPFSVTMYRSNGYCVLYLRAPMHSVYKQRHSVPRRNEEAQPQAPTGVCILHMHLNEKAREEP